MRNLPLVILVLAFGIQLGSAEEVWSSFVRSNRYDFKVTDEMIAKTPVWREKDDHPPLSEREALNLASIRLADLNFDSKEWKLDTLSLKELDDRRWVYLAVFKSLVLSQSSPVTVTIPITMTGYAVSPRVTPLDK